MDSRKIPTEALMLIGALAIFVMFGVALWISEHGTGSEVEFYISSIIIAIASFLLGSTGLVAMMRREFALRNSMVRGYPAIFLGFMIALAGWGMTLMVLYEIFARLFERIFPQV